MKEIPLISGGVAIIDDGDAEIVAPFRWTQAKSRRGLTYARSTCHRNGVRMHRLILGAKLDEQVDHDNGNGLDNRRENIRIATPSKQAMNRRRKENAAGPYKGVTQHVGGKWQAHIQKDGRLARIGLFSTAEEAARAYDRMARLVHGEYARINFPRQGERQA